jgi:hypothetical protein
MNEGKQKTRIDAETPMRVEERKIEIMVAQKMQLRNSEVNATVDTDNNTVTIEPNDRVRGFGVALELAEAIEFAKLILATEAALQAEFDGRFAECSEMDDIVRSESTQPYLW